MRRGSRRSEEAERMRRALRILTRRTERCGGSVLFHGGNHVSPMNPLLHPPSAPALHGYARVNRASPPGQSATRLRGLPFASLGTTAPDAPSLHPEMRKRPEGRFLESRRGLRPPTSFSLPHLDRPA